MTSSPPSCFQSRARFGLSGARSVFKIFHICEMPAAESDTFSCENYGVRISEESGDTAAIPGITTSAVRIDELLTLLVEHGVSPTALPDVISDWL